MQRAIFRNTFHFKQYLDTGKIPNKVYYKLINPNGQIIAGFFDLKRICIFLLRIINNDLIL
jgi:hypothetical protein